MDDDELGEWESGEWFEGEEDGQCDNRDESTDDNTTLSGMKQEWKEGRGKWIWIEKRRWMWISCR